MRRLSRHSPKDNRFIIPKTRLRRLALQRLLDAPVILETHGGEGALFRQCYMDVKQGVVIEKDPRKTEILAEQRPTWAVYEGDSAELIQAGVGGHLPINFLDCDPYGAAFDVLEAFFSSDRPFPNRFMVVVHDGLQGRLRRFGGWDQPCLQPFIQQLGEAGLKKKYLAICRTLLRERAALANYEIEHFRGTTAERHTHYFAELVQADSNNSSWADGGVGN